MTDELRVYISANVEAMSAAPSCCPEAKKAAAEWLKVAGTPQEDEGARRLIAELEPCIMPIDGCIEFIGSEAGKKVFADKAPAMLEHAKEVKASGRLYCDCGACMPISEILERKLEILS